MSDPDLASKPHVELEPKMTSAAPFLTRQGWPTSYICAAEPEVMASCVETIVLQSFRKLFSQCMENGRASR